jgi:putative zinc finger protein
VNCAAVRQQLPEHALGALDSSGADSVERHLAWCAACRKEAADLQSATATLALALPPADPDAALEGRVVEAIRSVATGPRRPAAARGRHAVAAVVAAMVAVSGLGWGAVMAGRAARMEEQAAIAEQRQRDAIENFENLVRTLEFTNPEAEASLGALASPRGGPAYGSAVTLVTPAVDDQVIVVVGGLSSGAREPYRVLLTDGDGHAIVLGTILTLDTAGGATIARQTPSDLETFRTVIVRDIRGRVALRGSLEARSSIPSPSP